MRRLLVTLAAPPCWGALSTTLSATSASAPQPRRAGSLHAVVTAPVGGDWAVRFVDAGGTVLSSVPRDAPVRTADGRVLADHVVSVRDDVVGFGTSDPDRACPSTCSRPARACTPSRRSATARGSPGLDRPPRREGRALPRSRRSGRTPSTTGSQRAEPGPRRPVHREPGHHRDRRVPAQGWACALTRPYFRCPGSSTSGYGVLVDNDEDSTFQLATAPHRGVKQLSVVRPPSTCGSSAGRRRRQRSRG